MRDSSAILTDPPPAPADARIAYGPDPRQFGDLRLPEGRGPFPLVVVILGGYWQATSNLIHVGHLCVDLVSHGIATWYVEYRLIGDVGGGWPATGRDAEEALEFVCGLVRLHPLDLDRVVVAGHSAGGQFAVLSSLRTDLPLRGVVSFAGDLDLELLVSRGDDFGLIARLLGGGPDELPERWREALPAERLPWPHRTVFACGTAGARYADGSVRP